MRTPIPVARANAILLDVVPVHRVIPDVLTSVVRKAPLTPEKVAFAWRMAVGARVDSATQIELREGTLHVLAREVAWQREVEQSAGVIRSRMAALLGPDVIRFIRVSAP
jgi:hypothetical protein